MYFCCKEDNGVKEVIIRSHLFSNALVFNTSHYTKASPDRLSVESLFMPINDFIATLAVDKQESIFKCYEKAHRLLNDIDIDIKQLKNELKHVVGDMYNNFTEESIHHWLLYKSNIPIHSEIRDVPYDSTPDERTYLTTDYRYLMALSLSLRMMIPLWGQLITRTQVNDGSDYKEYGVFSLINESWLADSRAVNRLTLYLKYSIDGKGVNDNIIIGGLSKDELPTYILTIGVVRRLPIANLHSNIVSNLYNYLILNVLGGCETGRRISTNLRAKRPEGGESDTLEGTSRAEEVKIKELISAGDRVAIDTFASKPFKTFVHIDPSIPEDKIIQCLQYVDALRDVDIKCRSHYTRLVQYVFCCNGIVIPPEAFESVIAKDNLLSCIAVTQAALWHWGFYHLAIVLTAVQDKNDSLQIVNIKERIENTTINEGSAIFTHNFTKPVVGDSSKRKEENTFSLAIDSFVGMIRFSEWKINCPPQLAREIQLTGSYMSLPVDIKEQVGRLFIKLCCL